MNTILIVDDDKIQSSLISAVIKKHLSIPTIEVSNGQACLDSLADPSLGSFKLVILDLEMPVMGGLEALPKIKKAFPDMPVIVVTGNDKPEIAAQAIKLGAMDFFSKPIQAERILASVRNALRIGFLNHEVNRLERETRDVLGFKDLIGAEGALKPVIDLARRAAGSDVPVLIHGETGVGKEVFARAIHGEGRQASWPFVAVNCGAIPENLIESTLFGHEKGSFTGAIAKTLGKFREAEKGTIFLDEVGELPLDAQVKLLRVLQEKEIEPVGAGRSVPINVRVISATNRDLQAEVEAGRFREDLYFRLNVLPVEIPPLRERRGDIAELSDFFLEKAATKDYRGMRSLDVQALAALQAYHWPGNVRELENTLHRSVILSDDEVLSAKDIHFFGSGGRVPVALSPDVAGAEDGGRIAVSLFDANGTPLPMKEIEMRVYQKMIEHFEGSVPKASKALGLAKSTLYRKLYL